METYIEHLRLPGAFVINLPKFGDERGFFSEVYNAAKLAETGFTEIFVQDNHSHSAQKGVIRGLHFQIPPDVQGKLVRVTRGVILDVVVDAGRGLLRRGALRLQRAGRLDVSARSRRAG